VEAFGRQHCRVAFLDNDDAAGVRMAARLAGHVAHAPRFVCADLRDAAAIGPVIDRLAGEIGPIRALINNAAHDERHSIESVTPDFWRERLQVNLDHQFFCAQAAARSMREAGGGAIVNMGSASWRLGLGGMPAYVTAKAAIEGLTRGLARDLGKHRIRVCCIAPGFVRTERQVEKWLTPELERTIFAGQCLPDFIEPADIANFAVFLASDAGRMCTNQTFVVDAGWS
jgi:NAD(P)-dependent dehydrogenase (short-subunit alcohol dehydrogenase family)